MLLQSNLWDCDVIRICFQSEALKGIAVVDGVRVVVLGHFNDGLVVFREMVDVGLADGRHVVHSVKEIGGEVGVGLPFCHIVAQCTQL